MRRLNDAAQFVVVLVGADHAQNEHSKRGARGAEGGVALGCFAVLFTKRFEGFPEQVNRLNVGKFGQ